MADVNVIFDISQLKTEITRETLIATEFAARSAVQTTIVAVHDKWTQEAYKRLKTTLPDYLLGLSTQSIKYPENGDYLTGSVTLIGDLAVAVEEGYGSFDMKTGFSKSSRRKEKADGGWYLTIPFRHVTPNAKLHGQPMTQSIYNRAKRLQPGQRLPPERGTQVSWAGYKHRNTIESGMTKIIKEYNNAKTGKTVKQSQYMTFRRVSDKSAGNSWIHPGFKGVKIAETLSEYATQTFIEVFENY